jgi:hypothetical protein
MYQIHQTLSVRTTKQQQQQQQQNNSGNTGSYTGQLRWSERYRKHTGYKRYVILALLIFVQGHEKNADGRNI